MSQPLAMFPILALVAGILGFSLTGYGFFSDGDGAEPVAISEFWGAAHDALESGEPEIALDPGGADAVCMIAKGADPIARLFAALGAAPETPGRHLTDRLTALALRADTAIAVDDGVVVAFAERPEWSEAVFLGGTTCAVGKEVARVIVHRRPAPFGGPRETVHFILTP